MQMNKPKRKGLGYRRVSGTTQKDNFSLKGQGDDIEEYYERKGILLDRMYTDVGSGLSIKQRPEFVKQNEHALDRTNGVTDIAFWDLDRFTRNIKEFFEFTDPLLEAGIHLHLVMDEEEFDYYSSDKWFQKLIDAQKESKRTSRRTKRGQRGATQEGRHIGKPPWGFTLIHDSDEKDAEGNPALCGRLAPDPATWENCKTFWRLADEGLTPMGIAIQMNRLGIPAARGGEWTDSSTRMVIRNPKYYGQLFRGVEPVTRIPGPKEEAHPILIENNHEPAVSPDSWKKINEEMQKRSRVQGPTRVHSSPNAASGKLKCGHCWSNGYDSNLEMNRQKDIVRLRCSRKKKVGGYDCGFKGVRLDAILPVLIDRLTNHFLTEDTLERVIDRIADESREYLETQETNQVGIRSSLRLAKEKVRNLKENLSDGGLGPRSRKSLTEDLEQQLGEQEELEKDLERISVSSQEARLFVNNRDGIIETAMNLKTYTDPENLDAVRQLINLFVEKVEVFDDGHAIVHYDLPVHSKGSEEGETEEIIYFEKKKTPVASQSCGLEQGTGVRLLPPDRFDQFRTCVVDLRDLRIPRRMCRRSAVLLNVSVAPLARGIYQGRCLPREKRFLALGLDL